MLGERSTSVNDCGTQLKRLGAYEGKGPREGRGCEGRLSHLEKASTTGSSKPQIYLQLSSY